MHNPSLRNREGCNFKYCAIRLNHNVTVKKKMILIMPSKTLEASGELNQTKFLTKPKPYQLQEQLTPL